MQSTPAIDPLWLLFRINGGDLATLQHIDLCMTKSDCELFICLKERYSLLRSKVAFVRRLFLQLSEIHFVQFQLLPRAYVAGLEIACLPPLERTEYTYKVVVSNPPVPPEWMVHVYKHPETGSEVTFCLDRFPKKRKEKLCYEHNAEILG
jgi:hypothetical protein